MRNDTANPKILFLMATHEAYHELARFKPHLLHPRVTMHCYPDHLGLFLKDILAASGLFLT